MKKYAYLMIFFFLIACSNDAPSTKEEITISAAASLTNALLEAKKEFELIHDSVEVHVNVGSSGTQQKQIEQGAPVDLFLSASSLNFHQLLDEGLIEQSSVIALLTNSIVLVKNKDSELAITDFSDVTNDSVKTIALGIPETVPVGQYSKELFLTLGIWDSIQPKIILAKDVRQVLTYVETGNVDAGIVYSSDALTSEKIEVMANAEKSLHSPIIYEMGIVKSSHKKELAAQFADFLQSEKALSIFRKYGFTPLKE
ncbi:molybdate ABC transporter substrate-binding protein [Bacillus sp. PS06]|uniref:molybdate ABC transporter substrate-binding protein n=1 Tax=Bacillus sp. PS06 TaxID=2764176 RepID=UPI001783DCF4|nr:molybdate ABC transporter substrate-binding protein [Bacillus sp. PS06]MBD8070494.1 molybdate ABC transporter substrate-binding protein [Bacillus sp. PS06]